jgi:TRAP-type uncharacterized transport system substrate-binding protein
VRIATGGQGTSYYAYGAFLRELLLKAAPPGSQIEVLPQGLAIANMRLIEEGKAELGFSFTPVARWAREGTVAFNQPLRSVRGLVGGMDVYWAGIIVRKELPINSLREIKE